MTSPVERHLGAEDDIDAGELLNGKTLSLTEKCVARLRVDAQLVERFADMISEAIFASATLVALPQRERCGWRGG